MLISSDLFEKVLLRIWLRTLHPRKIRAVFQDTFLQPSFPYSTHLNCFHDHLSTSFDVLISSYWISVGPNLALGASLGFSLTCGPAEHLLDGFFLEACTEFLRFHYHLPSRFFLFCVRGVFVLLTSFGRRWSLHTERLYSSPFAVGFATLEH